MTMIYVRALMSIRFLPLDYVEFIDLAGLVNDRLLVHIYFTFPHKRMSILKENAAWLHVIIIDPLAYDIVLAFIDITDP